MTTARPERTGRSFGYHPGIDGLRAVSVIAVLFYHAGFGWMRGGFLGVEVFFVISGFLITTLLIEEHERNGRVSLREFWTRRAKRLLPALFLMMLATATWFTMFGTDAERSSLRRELPWSVFYANNWGQIVGETPYFGGVTDPLRHLWSLAIEEQWYVVWPLVFVALATFTGTDPVRRRIAALVVLLGAFASIAHMFTVAGGDGALISSGIDMFDGADRVNFLYLSTTTRVGGLLLGAATAFVWRPWTENKPRSLAGKVGIDTLTVISVAVLGALFTLAQLDLLDVYRWVIPLTSLVSVALAVAATHPTPGFATRLLSLPLLVAIGRRSYGLYLWSWPISVIVGATSGSVARFVIAMILSVVVTELSYRFVETRARRASWSLPSLIGAPRAFAVTCSVAVVAAVVSAIYVQTDRFNEFRGDDVVFFDAEVVEAPTPAATSTTTTTITTTTAPPAAVEPDADTDTTTTVEATTSTTTTTTTTLPPVEFADLAIVGDSTAQALLINRPAGIDEIYPEIIDGALDGCGVFDSGRILTEASFRNDFSRCRDGRAAWGRAASDADVVMVVIGAWDVFDLRDGDVDYEFASAEWNELYTTNLRSGLDLMLLQETRIAILEVPCMRPVSSTATALPPLPERGDDARVAHVNSLLLDVADEYGSSVRFIEGPDEWCESEEVATDRGLRWDGVHVYGEGANMIYEATAGSILRLAAVPL
ncbi:MAG: acyltransferase family protein [Ilumatobacter sp.]